MPILCGLYHVLLSTSFFREAVGRYYVSDPENMEKVATISARRSGRTWGERKWKSCAETDGLAGGCCEVEVVSGKAAAVCGGSL
ncbi:MAG: hypothetical protein NC337_02375 [Roseburia sp.]|nr:hypothetical protein [Roseburia sp.]